MFLYVSPPLLSLSMLSIAPSQATSVWFAVWPCMLMRRGQRAAFKRAAAWERERERDLSDWLELHPGAQDAQPELHNQRSRETPRSRTASAAHPLWHPADIQVDITHYLHLDRVFVVFFVRIFSFGELGFLRKASFFNKLVKTCIGAQRCYFC